MEEGGGRCWRRWGRGTGRDRATRSALAAGGRAATAQKLALWRWRRWATNTISPAANGRGLASNPGH
eukprot:197546-Lingulodinium_polyedra.AAC.1